MILHFPLLRDRDPPYLPARDCGCVICGNPFDNGSAVLSAGAVIEHDVGDPALAFFDVGFHSQAVDVSGSANVDVVNDLHGGQFDFNFCSTACLRRFFVELVDELERRLSVNPHTP